MRLEQSITNFQFFYISLNNFLYPGVEMCVLLLFQETYKAKTNIYKRNWCNTFIFYEVMINFVSFSGVNFGLKSYQKWCIFVTFWYILRVLWPMLCVWMAGFDVSNVFNYKMKQKLDKINIKSFKIMFRYFSNPFRSNWNDVCRI